MLEIVGHLWWVYRSFYKTHMLLVREVFNSQLVRQYCTTNVEGATLSLFGGLSYPDCTGPSTNCENLVKQNQYFLTVYWFCSRHYINSTIQYDMHKMFHLLLMKILLWIMFCMKNQQNWDKSWTCEHNLLKIGKTCKEI